MTCKSVTDAPTAAASLPVSSTAASMYFFSAGADDETLQRLAEAGRQQHGRGNRLDDFVGFSRAPIRSAAALAPRADDGHVVGGCLGLLQDFADRFPGAENDLG